MTIIKGESRRVLPPLSPDMLPAQVEAMAMVMVMVSRPLVMPSSFTANGGEHPHQAGAEDGAEQGVGHDPGQTADQEDLLDGPCPAAAGR